VRFDGIPFPHATPKGLVTGLPEGFTGIQLQARLLHSDWALRARVVTATALEYDPERNSPWFICACHLEADCIVPGQREGSWRLAPGMVPLTPGQMHNRAPPTTLLPEMRAAEEGRLDEIAVVLHRQDIMKAEFDAKITALKLAFG
jgi:hypothetical protein